MGAEEGLLTTFCLACNAKLGYPAAKVGKRIRCPICGDSRMAPDLFEATIIDPARISQKSHRMFPVAARVWSRRLFQVISTAAAAGLCGFLAMVIASVVCDELTRVDRHKWTSERGVQYLDYGAPGAAVHRRVSWVDLDSTGSPLRANVNAGPMAGETKPHGRWIEAVARIGQWPERTVQFYWYGEPISEGEWHLRNDRR
jgi:hypothetical protein